MDMNKIELNGQAFENAPHLLKRIGVSDFTLRKLLKRGMPQPIKIGRVRYFDTAAVDGWLMSK